jgi:hypothetical protein
MVYASATNCHLPSTCLMSRNSNCPSRIPCLMTLNMGTGTCLRRPYGARPAAVLSRCAILATGSTAAGGGPESAWRSYPTAETLFLKVARAVMAQRSLDFLSLKTLHGQWTDCTRMQEQFLA